MLKPTQVGNLLVLSPWVGSWLPPQILDLTGKAWSQAYTLAYRAALSVTQKNCFVTFTPEDDITGNMELLVVIIWRHRIEDHEQKSGHKASNVIEAYEQQSML